MTDNFEGGNPEYGTQEVAEVQLDQVDTNQNVSNPAPVIEQPAPAPQQERSNSDRPRFSHGTYYSIGAQGHGFSISSGPEVAYVNQKLGVSGGDTFTPETRQAVIQWQVDNGRAVSGELSQSEYNDL